MIPVYECGQRYYARNSEGKIVERFKVDMVKDGNVYGVEYNFFDIGTNRIWNKEDLDEILKETTLERF